MEEAFKKLEIDPEIDVVFMRTDTAGSRTLYDDGKINQLFQGRSKVESPTSYPGDANLPNAKPYNIQVQIHNIKPSNRSDIDYSSIQVAIYIPSEIADDISKLVGRI